jgi:hypothetical protein
MPKACSRLGIAVSTCASFALFTAPVQGRPHLQAVGESSVGYTDNAQDTPSGDEARTGSLFWMVSPGVVLALASSRRLQRIAYHYEYDLYFNSAVSSGSTNRLDYRGFFDLSPRVNLVLGANVSESDRFTKLTFSAPGAGTVGAVPTGTGSFLQGGVDQSLGLDVTEGWRGWQTANARGDSPIFETTAPRTIGAGLRLGIERSFLADAVGVEARGDYTVVSGSVDLDGSAATYQRQLLGGGAVLWRHDWSRELTSSAELGILRVERLNTHHGFWTPTALATLSYATEDGDAQLAYGHSVTTNALVGQSLLVDEVTLRGELPLTSKGELSLAGSMAYQHGRLLDENAELATRVNVALADVALGWQATKLLTLGVRLQHIEQKSGADTPPLPVSFVQNNVLIGASVRFPAERDMPRAYRAPRRVDRSDELRDGFDPAATGPRGPRDPGGR